MSKIKAIIVDYGGVFVEQPSEPANLARIAQAVGISATQLKEAVYGTNRELWNRAKLGMISEVNYWAEVENNLHVSLNKILWLKRQLFEVPHVYDEFLNFLKTLQGNYALAILSNAIPVFSRTWESLGFNDLFDVMINSSLVGLAKPDPQIYKLALEQLNLPAQACLVVDDQVKNIAASRSFGFEAVHYVNSAQAVEEINKLLLSQ